MIQKNIVWILVNYGTDQDAITLIESIKEATIFCQLNLILVDNTERLESREFFDIVTKLFPNVLCVKPEVNLGYFGGAYRGLSKYLESNNFPDWIIVSNVDIVLGNKSFFTNLCQLSEIESVGIIAPRIWSRLYNREDNPYLKSRISIYKLNFYKILNRYLLLGNSYALLSQCKIYLNQFSNWLFANSHKFFSKAEGNNRNDNSLKSEFIYAPHGACIVFCKSYFDRGGTISYPGFLYAEELYVAETAIKIGLQILYYPQLHIEHKHQVSTKLFRSQKKNDQLYRSIDYIIHEYFKH